jgi:hypothetical protein
MSAAHKLVLLTQRASAYMRVPYMFLCVPVEDKSLPQPEESEHPIYESVVEVMTSAMSGPSEHDEVHLVSSIVPNSARHDQGHGRVSATYAMSQIHGLRCMNQQR